MKLYPFQERNVESILSNPRKRWVLDETGLGKSVTGIAAAQQLKAQRVLVVTLGMVRPAWLERLREWWPERADDVAAITIGRHRQSLSKPAQARVAAAYAAPIQVVSYDLLAHVDQYGWDCIILDEIHEHVSFRSGTSQQLRNLFGHSDKAVKLGLTATLVTAEPKNTWNLLHLFWREEWGHPLPSGDPPWWFQQRYCERHEVDWGTGSGVSYKGLNPLNAPMFARKIGDVSMRTLRSDVADLLPPIDCSPLLIESSNRKTDDRIALEWLDTATRESTHVSLFTYFRESAYAQANLLRIIPRYRDDWHIEVVTGDTTTEKRAVILQRLRDAPRAILVGTMDSLGTGISLTAFQQYLITEMVTTASKLVQMLGRFSRLDSKVPCRGFVLLREGRDDDKLCILRQRLQDFNTLIRGGQGEQSLLSVLDSPLEGEAFDRRLDDLIANFRGDVDADDDDGEDDDAA